MKVYPSDIEEAVKRSKEIAQQSKQAVQPPAPNHDHIAQQWEIARAARQK